MRHCGIEMVFLQHCSDCLHAAIAAVSCKRSDTFSERRNRVVELQSISL